jgi:Mn-dependent DtxR family transcriptional regulator
MPKTFPIRLEVEEVALGTVLRKLNEMPGIAKLHLDLERGGEGSGRKELEQVASKMRETTEQAVIRILMSGEKSTHEIAQELGWRKPRVYQTTHVLRKKGITESGYGKGTHRLTLTAEKHLDGGTKALPAPALKRGPKGRVVRGAAKSVLHSILIEGPKSPTEVRKAAATLGFSPNSVGGLIERAKRDGLIKKNGHGYGLTAKGLKIQAGAPVNG